MLDKGLLSRLRTVVGSQNLVSDAAECLPYGYDNSRRQAQPDGVVFARTHEQVRALLQFCNSHRLPVVARGRGTGTTGATVPVRGGLVLSFERMTRILEVDPANRMARVEPGATNQALQDRVAAEGFFWPPDPTSAAFSTIGGNLAYNSAGPRAVKYGTPRENTLGLRCVTGSGEEIQTGTRTTKGVVGLDLTRLIIGSEGTLAIITEALLKLTPRSEAVRTLRAVYSDVRSAALAVSRIMAQATVPCALEFMDGEAINLLCTQGGLDLPAAAGAVLMIEVDETRRCVDIAAGLVSEVAHGPGCLEVRTARSAQEVGTLWAARKALSPALRNIAPGKINEDVVVPVSRLAELIDGLSRLSAAHRIPIVNFGHAGNGNVHVNLLVHPEDPQEMSRARRCLDETFSLVLELGGTLSGEHGVGLVKRGFVAREIASPALRIMHGIKREFDPNGILNPDKMLPDQE